MGSGRLHARLDKLSPASRRRWRIVTIFPEDWSAEAQAAYAAAVLAGDTDWQDAIIVQKTGEPVELGDGAGIRVIEIRTTPNGRPALARLARACDPYCSGASRRCKVCSPVEPRA